MDYIISYCIKMYNNLLFQQSDELPVITDSESEQKSINQSFTCVRQNNIKTDKIDRREQKH